MKSGKLLFSSLMLIGGLVAYLSLSSNSSGMPGVSSTGCGGSTCHSSSTATTILLTGIPAAGFVAGTTYTLTLSVSNSTKAAAGFDLGVSSGILSAAPVNTAMPTSGEMYHTQPKVFVSGGTSWTFNWTAPATSAVIFNISANAVDNTGTSANDAYATTALTFLEAPSTVLPPIIVSNLVTAVSATTATIDASVNANGGTTAVSIDYGLTTSYGSNKVTTPSSVIGTGPSAVNAVITGLTPSTTYHYRMRAMNSAGTTLGTDGTFATNPSAVSDIEKTDFKIYPNPTTDYLFFKSATAFSKIQFNVIALDGSRCNVLSEQSASGEYKINMKSMATGNYILYIHADNQVYQYAFAKR